MRVLGGRLLRDDGVIEGTVEVDPAGRVTEVREGEDAGQVDQPGLVVPAATNAHTHVADRIARNEITATSLEEVVAPPDGLKHRLLDAATDQQLVTGMRLALAEADRAGAPRVLDFREGGPRGAALARRAQAGTGVDLALFGRPTRPEAWEAEADELLALVDGIGISGLQDQPYEISRAQAEACRKTGKPLALHLSEGRREDTQAALDLAPDLIVHATHATDEDIQALAEAGPSVALCPRSNALFGNRPPVTALLEAGVTLGLGTDNAMFHLADPWAEAAFVLDRWPGIEPTQVLEMLTRFHLPGQPRPEVRPGHRVVVLDDSKGLRLAIAHHRVSTPWRDIP